MTRSLPAKEILKIGDIKGSWRAINKIINKKSKSTKINNIKYCGRDISSNSEIANVMNDHICTIGTGHAKNIEEMVNPLLSGRYQMKISALKFKFGPIWART